MLRPHEDIPWMEEFVARSTSEYMVLSFTSKMCLSFVHNPGTYDDLWAAMWDTSVTERARNVALAYCGTMGCFTEAVVRCLLYGASPVILLAIFNDAYHFLPDLKVPLRRLKPIIEFREYELGVYQLLAKGELPLLPRPIWLMIVPYTLSPLTPGRATMQLKIDKVDIPKLEPAEQLREWREAMAVYEFREHLNILVQLLRPIRLT
jgi:hypothetical protein